MSHCHVLPVSLRTITEIPHVTVITSVSNPLLLQRYWKRSINCLTHKIRRTWRKGLLSGIVEKVSGLPLVRTVIRHRFMKFGTVGFSGTIINLIVLYLNQEYLFRGINPAQRRLHLSLSGAIFVATLSNYIWNRVWTWNDRMRKTRHGFFVQMGQYFLSSGLAICIQYIFTILISYLTHYIIANILAIVIAAIFTYLLNDIWTFALRKDLR